LILKALDFAKAIGARNVSITSGRCLGGMPPDRAAGQFADSIKPILDRAAAVDVNVGIECEPGLYLEYIAELREWIDRLNHPCFGANLDVGHSVVMGESVPEVVDLVKGRIWNLHVEDLPGRKHYHMIPGEGTFDWRALRASLEGIGYDRFLTVELYTHTADPHAAADKSYRFLTEAFGS
jgi:sugar phosphate isomerase/epimerase